MKNKNLIYILKRIILAVLTLLIVITVTFFAMNAIPGGPFQGERAISDSVKQALNEKYGLDQPVYKQYFSYLGRISHGDFGPSIKKTGSQVTEIIASGFKISGKIGIIAAVLAIIFGIVLGVIAAIYKNSWIDRLITLVTTAFIAMPSFIIGTFLLIIFVVQLGWFPAKYATGIPGMDRALVLPIICLMLYPTSYITKLVKSSMDEVLNADFVRTARAYGIPWYKIIFKYALRNAISPVITYSGPMIAFILTGSMIVEQIFGIPGLGSQLVNSITNRDYLLIMGITIFIAVLVISINLITDIIYVLVDPRIELE